MILKFTFLFEKSNKGYFLKIMQNLASDLNLRYANTIIKNELLFFINGSEEDISSFANMITDKMPLSLYFVFKKVEMLKEMPKDCLPIECNTSCFDFDLEELINIKDLKSKYFCDIFSYPKDQISFDITFFGDKISSKDQLYNALKTIINKLKSKEIVKFQTTKGRVLLSIEKNDFDFIMANDISTINLYTRANKDELDFIATFEKPVIELFIKDLFINELGFQKALFVLPYDPILYIISSFLIEDDIPFLYLKNIVDFTNDGLYYENKYNDNFFEIVVGSNGHFIEKRFMDSNIDINSFIESSFNNEDPMLTIYLSTNSANIFKLQNYVPLIKIDFDANPKNLINKLSKSVNGNKLIENYTKIYEDRMKSINNFCDDVMPSNNIIDLFQIISIVLGSNDRDIIFKYANDCLIDTAPRIDFKTINIDGSMCYNPIPTISSVISFILAGVEKEVICCGIFDSLADFLIGIIRDVNVNYNVKNIGIIGNLFANKIFFSRITKKISQNFVLHYPKYIDL